MARARLFHADDSRELSAAITHAYVPCVHCQWASSRSRYLRRLRNHLSLPFVRRLIHAACALHDAIDEHINERRFARVARHQVMRLMSEIMAHTITLHLLDAPRPLACTRKSMRAISISVRRH